MAIKSVSIRIEEEMLESWGMSRTMKADLSTVYSGCSSGEYQSL